MSSVDADYTSHSRNKASVDGNVAPVVTQCLDSLKHIKQTLGDILEENEGEQTQAAIQEYEGRFRVWCGNLAAHQSGKSSLDHRLKDASKIKSKVLKLLQNLNSLVKEADAICSGQQSPAEHDSCSSSSSEDVSDPDDDKDESGELTQVLIEISSIIDCLYRMSMNLRNLGGNRRYRKSAKIDVSFYEPYDIQFMKQLYPLAEEYLCERLGKAISRRRQFLRYQELHARKLAAGIISDDNQTITQSETTASTLQQDSSSNLTPISSAYVDVDEESIISATSYATIPGATNSIRWPLLPKNAEMGIPYKCPYCHTFIDAEITSQWRRHIVRDLQPYLCTWERCVTGPEMYASRKLWWQHEMEFHRQTWICVNHCQENFFAKADFIKHCKRTLPSLTDDQLNVLSKVCTRSSDTSIEIVCPLCKEKQKGSLHLGKHIARHLEEIALRALPAVPEGYEQESGDDLPSEGGDEIATKEGSEYRTEDGDWVPVSVAYADRFTNVESSSNSEEIDGLKQTNQDTGIGSCESDSESGSLTCSGSDSTRIDMRQLPKLPHLPLKPTKEKLKEDDPELRPGFRPELKVEHLKEEGRHGPQMERPEEKVVSPVKFSEESTGSPRQTFNTDHASHKTESTNKNGGPLLQQGVETSRESSQPVLPRADIIPISRRSASRRSAQAQFLHSGLRSASRRKASEANGIQNGGPETAAHGLLTASRRFDPRGQSDEPGFEADYHNDRHSVSDSTPRDSQPPISQFTQHGHTQGTSIFEPHSTKQPQENAFPSPTTPAPQSSAKSRNTQTSQTSMACAGRKEDLDKSSLFQDPYTKEWFFDIPSDDRRFRVPGDNRVFQFIHNGESLRVLDNATTVNAIVYSMSGFNDRYCCMGLIL